MNRKRISALLLGLGVMLASAGCGDNEFPPLGVTDGGGAATGVITGQVAASGVPVGGVQVIVVNRDSMRTDANGQFRFENVPPATYNVAIRVPQNYALAAGEESIKTAEVSAGEIQAVNWLLLEDEPIALQRPGYGSTPTLALGRR